MNEEGDNMSKYYETKNKNEFGVPMVIETFKDDDMQYAFCQVLQK